MSSTRLLTAGILLFSPVVPLSAQDAPTPMPTPVEVTENPLLNPWTTPHEVPPFDRIRDEHYGPAFDVALQQHEAEIAAISSNPEPPTFANTLDALERSGRLLDRVSSVFFALNSAHSNDNMRALARELAPRLAANTDNVLLNEPLFRRVDALYRQRDALGLTPEQRRLLEETHKRFTRGGIALEDAQKERLRAINAELSSLSQAFSQNQLEETNSYALWIEDEADLEGLPQSLIDAAAAEATRRGRGGQWAFTLHSPSIWPFLSNSPRRELRERIFNAYANRGSNGNEYDNREIASRTAALRAERAKLLGYPTHADFVLTETMASTPEATYRFLDRLWEPALARAKAEAADLEALLHADGYTGPLQPWDWWYYTERLRKERYSLDEQTLRQYFPFENVRQGAFDLATKLWGVTFHERPDLPVYHEDVEAFEVREADGRHIGILYTDYFTRPSKRSGAWMTSARRQWKLDSETTPVVFNVGNFTPPANGRPSLLSFEEVTTLFHEFGHGLHGLFSNVTYPSLSGTAVSRDFVEFPSQIMENWPGEAEFLKTFARHYETGEVIPDSLVDRLQAAAKFNEGFRTTEYLAASYLDLAWHRLEEPEQHDAERFERQEMERIGLISSIIPRYRSPYFSHIFSGGYSAGYYSYIWAAVLDADGFEAFRETGLYDADLAARLRETVLSRGNTIPSMQQYIDFRGREPDVAPLLRRRGLDGGSD